MSIDIAVVGLGKMGVSHLAIAHAIEGLNVSTVIESSALIGSVVGKYTGLNFVEDYDTAIAQPGLQAVIIATPTPHHEAMARSALERGLHVFCEKPLTLSGAESRALAALAEERGLVTQVGYHNRFIGTFREVKRLVEAGAIGKVSHIQAQAYGPVVLKPAKATWRHKAGGGGGCLYDYAAHPLNLMNWYFGPAQACSGAMLKSGFSREVDDEVYASLRFVGGVTGQLSVNWSDHSVRKMSTEITIWGEHGRICANRQELRAFLAGSAKVPEGYRKGWTEKYITELTPPVSFYLRGEEYSAQIEAFAAAIAAGKGATENSFASAAETDEAIELIRASAAAEGALQGEASQVRPKGRGGLAGLVFRR